LSDYLDFLKSIFERSAAYLYSPQAPEDPWCRQIKCGVYECVGYRELTIEEQLHIDFPGRFGPLTPRKEVQKFLDGKEETEYIPVEYKGKWLMKEHLIGYDYDEIQMWCQQKEASSH